MAIGSELYVKHWLLEKERERTKVVEETSSLLEGDLQAMLTLLTNPVAQKLNYRLSLQYPSKVLPTAGQILGQHRRFF